MLRSRIRLTVPRLDRAAPQTTLSAELSAEHDVNLQIGVCEELMKQLLELSRAEVRLEGRAELYRSAEERRVLFNVREALVHVSVVNPILKSLPLSATMFGSSERLSTM